MKNYIVIETFNGEGYSNPQLYKEKNEENALSRIEALMYNYDEESFEVSRIDDFSYTFDDGQDQGAIQVIEVTDNYNLIEVQPDVNEVYQINVFDTLEEALEELAGEVISTERMFDQEDINDYDGELHFGSHSNEGYIHLEII